MLALNEHIIPCTAMALPSFLPYPLRVHAPASARRWSPDEVDEARLKKAATRVFGPEPEVIAVYLYGSAARGEPAVDLDVAVLLDAPLEASRLETLASRLQEEGAPAGPLVDLRPLWGAGPRFQANVLREGRLLFERDFDKRVYAEATIMSRWADFKPVWEKMRRRMAERWLRG